MFYICSRKNFVFEDDVLSQKFLSAYANKNYVTIDNLTNLKKDGKELNAGQTLLTINLS